MLPTTRGPMSAFLDEIHAFRYERCVPQKKLTPTEISEVIAKIRKKYDEYVSAYYKPKSLKEAFERRYIGALRSGVDVSTFLLAEISAIEELIKKALKERVSQFDLLSLDTHQSVARLIAVSIYPPLRGTRFTVGEVDFLYTTGFIAELGQFHSLHVPSPIRVSDHIGQDTPRDVLLKEILVLTKMNWNSSRLGGKSPITLRFSDLVGEIMREIPTDREPMPQFKFYM